MEIFANTTEAQEMAAMTNTEPVTAREQLESALLDIADKAGLPEITGMNAPVFFVPFVWMLSVLYQPDEANSSSYLMANLFSGEPQMCKLRLIHIPAARCYTYRWDKDNFGKL